MADEKPSEPHNAVFSVAKSKALKTFEYQRWKNPQAIELKHDAQEDDLKKKLDAFIQVATQSLLDNTAGLNINARKNQAAKTPERVCALSMAQPAQRLLVVHDKDGCR